MTASAKVSGLGDLWADGHLHVDIDHQTLGDAHSLKSGLVTMDYGAVKARYVEKWGGEPPNETFPTPFNRLGVDHRWCWVDEVSCMTG